MVNKSICGFSSWAATNVGLLVTRVHARGQITRGFFDNVACAEARSPTEWRQWRDPAPAGASLADWPNLKNGGPRGPPEMEDANDH